MIGGFTLLSEAEYQHYRASLDWYGYSEQDFELIETPTQSGPSDTQPRGRISVTRKATGVTRYYHVGVGMPWTEQLDDDLRRGVFRPR
jgi:hypothetical protein